MLVLCLLEYLKLNSRRERGESHFFILKSILSFIKDKKKNNDNININLNVKTGDELSCILWIKVKII